MSRWMSPQAGGAVMLFMGGVALFAALAIIGGTLLTTVTHGNQRLNLGTSAQQVVAQAAYVLTTEATRSSGGLPVAPAHAVASRNPDGGGIIPAVSGAPASDAFGTPLGYCTGTAANLGSAVLAVVSAGANREFETTCAEALLGERGGDDAVQAKTAANVLQAMSGTVHFKEPVANVDALRALTDVLPGEMRVVLDPGTVYINADGVPDSGWAAAVVSGSSGGDPGSLRPCKSGYVAVDGFTLPDGEYVPPFCVMQYEARIVNSRILSSDVAAFGVQVPENMITWQQAKAMCASDGVAMITDSQWLSLAHQIVGVDANWSGGAVGSGLVAGGWGSSEVEGGPWTNTGPAPSNDASCLYNTGADTCGASGDHRYRRTHVLPNGNSIWDLSGNFWEYTDTTIPSANRYYGGNATWMTYNVADAAYPAYVIMDESRMPISKLPPNDWNAAQGMGRYYDAYWDGAPTAAQATETEAPFVCAPGTAVPAYCDPYAVFIRGGVYTSADNLGVFALATHMGRSAKHSRTGFRCAYRNE